MTWETFMPLWLGMADEMAKNLPAESPSFPAPANAREIDYGPRVDPITLRPVYAGAGGVH